MIRRDGRASVPFELSIVNLVDDPTVRGLVVSGHDISQLRATQAVLDERRFPSTRSPICPTGSALCRRLERCLGDPKTAVIFLDLDGFKPINDEFGQRGGRRVCCGSSATGCSQSVRRADFVARHGGDEFVVVARTENDGDLEKLSQRLARAIEHPTELSDRLHPSERQRGPGPSLPGRHSRDDPGPGRHGHVHGQGPRRRPAPRRCAS